VITEPNSIVMSTVDASEMVRLAERELRMVFAGASVWSSGLDGVRRPQQAAWNWLSCSNGILRHLAYRDYAVVCILLD
jgi:hypothetical protein